MKKEIYQYWLANLPRIGPRKTEMLLRIFGSVETVFHASKEELEKTIFEKNLSEGTIILNTDIETLVQQRDLKKAQEEYTRLIEKGISFITKEDDCYPEKLKQIYDAPYAIYVKGNLPSKNRKALAIVGARNCSSYGKEMARYIAGAVAKEGISIISGLARGIDSFAHEGALAEDGITYGILGCGIDICYPQENIKLYRNMQQKGGIISEYAPGVKPLPSNFPMRNRIISGLCDGILVIEAKKKSGSLITVDMGLEQGKEIYALPGRTVDIMSEGCNNLIKMGAKLVTSPKDILEDFISEYSEKPFVKNKVVMQSEQEERVYACLNTEQKHIEEIALLTRLPVEQLMELLLVLELRGVIKQTRKNYYSKMLQF